MAGGTSPSRLSRPEERGEFPCAQTENALSLRHHSADVIRPTMRFDNVYLFDFFWFAVQHRLRVQISFHP